MTRTGLLAATVVTVGLAGPAGAGLPGSSALLDEAAPPRQMVDNDIVRPPQPDIDPDMAVTPPSHGGTIRIIPPPGAPEKGVEPR